MDRLTQHTRYGWQFSGLPTLALDLDSHETGIYNKAAQRLAQYESTGLAPNEIQKMVQGCELCTENENFVQNKFGYCFYSLGPCPLVYNLYVHPQYRHCGHSKRLLELVIAEIRESEYDGKIFVQAKPKENSIGLNDLTEYYKRMGLTVFEGQPPKGEKP